MSIISEGIILFFTGFFAFLIISLTRERSCSPANDTDTPTRPALAVLPTLINNYKIIIFPITHLYIQI